MKARLLGGIAALIVAIIGTALLVSYVQNADKRALANTETESVYVVQKPIPAGASVQQLRDSVALKDLPRSSVSQDRVNDLSELDTKVTSLALVPGEQLLTTRMVDPASFLGPSRVAVPPGMQEVTLKLSIERVVGGVLRAGDTVGVFLSIEGTESNLETGATADVSLSQLTFHKVLVTGVQFSNGGAAQTQGSNSGQGTGTASAATAKNASTDDTYLVTIARDSADAQKVVFAAEFGTVYLSKEPAESVENDSGIMDGSRLFQ